MQASHLQDDTLSTPVVKQCLDTITASFSRSESAKECIRTVLHTLKETLDHISAKKIKYDSAAVRNTLRVTAPGLPFANLFRSEGCESLQISCAKPVGVNVVGGYMHGYSTGTVDVCVGMDASMFQGKDYLNHRYHDKRLLYLIYIARALVKGEKQWTDVSLKEGHLNGDSEKPCLTLGHKDLKGVKIRLIPTIADDVFEKDKLGDMRRNVRPAGDSSAVDDATRATIAYNHSVLIDMTFMHTLQIMHAITAAAPNFTGTMFLLRAWCIRNVLFKSNFSLACLLVDLINRGVAPKRASREHLLRCALNAIRNGRLGNLEVSGIRVCVGLDESLLKRASLCAATSLRIIESKTATDDPWSGVVPYMFASARGMKCVPKPLSTLFDGFVKVTGNVEDEALLKVLKSAFLKTKRVNRIEHLDEGMFGLVISSYSDTLRKVDMCSSDADAEEFKRFWGDRVSLRRFKDGTIAQAAIWSGGIQTLQEMASYAMERHFEGLKCNVVLSGLESAAGMARPDAKTSRAIAAYDELSTLLRGIEGLPLDIVSVHATSPYLRRCGAYTIRPSVLNRFIQPLDIVAAFESTGAWPDDAIAIAAAKAAFYVALKSKLAGQGIVSAATISFLDITLGGFVFRLRIRVDKEKHILKDKPEDLERLLWTTETRVRHHENIRNVDSPIMGPTSRLAKRWLNAHMLLSQFGERADEVVEVIIAGILSRHGIAPPKSTFAAFCQFLHLLAEFPWEVCPLSVLVQDKDLSPAEERMVDPDEKFEDELVKFMQSAQKAFSQQPASLAVFCDQEDGEAVSWFSGQYAPDHVITVRTRETARASLKLIEAHVKDPEKFNLASVFAPPKSGFDVVMKIDPRQIAYHSKSAQGVLRCVRDGRGHETLLAGFDPVSKVIEILKQRLGRYAMFLSRQCGGDEIFAAWRPVVEKEEKFSLRETAFRTPIASEDGKRGQLFSSKEALVEEMRQIGGDLFIHVEHTSGSDIKPQEN